MFSFTLLGQFVAAENSKRNDLFVATSSNDGLRESRTVLGWTLHIHRELIVKEADHTQLAVELLEKQLKEIVRVVPKQAVAELQKVPLYFSPAYAGKRAGAEYHPDAKWLVDNQRDPVMAKSVEFSNIRTFEQEMNRMPNFALHELAHAFHNRVLTKGFGNAEIKNSFENAKNAKTYERVERWHGNGKPNTFERAYGMNNPMEYFAETTEAYFGRNDFFPFTREELKQVDPEMCALLERLWNSVESGK